MNELKFLGDVFLDKPYPLEFVLDKFIFNLEYPLSTNGEPAKNKINLGSDNPNIFETFGKFPLAVNLANNHIMDYGEEGFAKTIDYLNLNKIGFFGAGNELNNFNNPYVLEEMGVKTALFGYSCISTNAVFGNENKNGSALLNENKVISDIKSIKKQVDWVVLQLHWGDEEIPYPKSADVKKSKMFIDAGADLIIGHHAHVIQSMEKYKNKFIFYGIGNFIFPDFCVPSNYDGQVFLKSSSKIQRKANKKSIVVSLNNELQVTYETVIFENNRIKHCKIKVPKTIPKSSKIYNRVKILSTKKRMIELFLRNPRIPSFLQIKLLLGIDSKKKSN